MKTETKILIAEDNTMNQRLIKHLMQSRGYQFDLVGNGAEAVESLKKQSYELVLMDIQMPVLDGYTATGQIRKELKSAIPVIAMTAHAMSGDREKCINAGMNEYLTKPLDEEVLFALIEKYMPKNPSGHGNLQKDAQGDRVIDLKVIDKYAHGDVEFKKEMIREFVATVPESINSLEYAISQGNYSKIGRIAHDMKTTIHVMGLSSLLGHLLKQIETFAQTNTSLSMIINIFSDIKRICMRAVREADILVALA
jgi:CheY-like chemotaxis protein/HPt (histidine-containing phosphotransfer) domain-containing protein